MSDTLPVFVNVKRPDGSVEQVRVGSAFRSGEGFTLQLGEMTIGSQPVASAPRASAPASAPAYSSGGGGGGSFRSSGGAPTNFPNYGRSKGAPIAGATAEDLTYYASGCRRTLGDPAKSRWHDKERELLAVIEAEMARQGLSTGGDGGGGGRGARPSFMQNEPYPGGAGGGGGGGGRSGGGSGEFEPPPPGDDDIPF